ncbi:MAG TPA: hypothetical protein PK936_10985 [Smithellaceae bacterium]|nr:hypothetical protein [Smithellaceae bacterium]
MLKVIDDEKLIARYARLFTKSFRPFVDEKIRVKLGHQGASFGAKVAWSKKLGIWIFSQATRNVRYWNAFGRGKPPASGQLPITAEINFPWAGIDRRTGAAFAQDAQKQIYVIHRGIIGGGKKGIGKSLFEENYRGVWAWMEDGGSLSQVAVVGLLGSERFALQAAGFVEKIEKLKLAAFRSPQTSLDFPEVSFAGERVGNPPSSAPEEETYASDHDLIVSHLASLLARRKWKIGNDEGAELFILRPASDSVSALFAVCADRREKSVLAAAAKLLLQKSDRGGHPRAILVLPEDEANRYSETLRRISIEVFGYRLEGERILFPDLDRAGLDRD